MISFPNHFEINTYYQHRFRERKSTQTVALCKLSPQKAGGGLFFDLFRAFDVLYPEYMMNKLYIIGFLGVFLDLDQMFFN